MRFLTVLPPPLLKEGEQSSAPEPEPWGALEIALRSVCSHLVAALAIALLSVACRHDDVIFIPEHVDVARPELTSVRGFFLLNEGNMGTNKATLDYYNYASGRYTRNVFAFANPDVPKELGDVGNDLAIYGTRLYAVVNCSNKVDVMDRMSVRKIGQVDIPNCRNIRFHGRYAYVTSYAGPVQIDENYKQLGYVAKVDTATLEVVDRCIVGFQPDELEIVGDRIYVANSGGYMVPNYENTLSVIDLATFREVERVEIDINLQCVRGDDRGVLWVSSRGDYLDTPGRLYAYDTRKRRIVATLDVPVASMAMRGDSLYVVSSQWSEVNRTAGDVRYLIVNTATMQVVNDGFITDGTDDAIQRPYGIAVNPVTGDILIADARSYVTPGTLYCLNRHGTLLWQVRTGDIPAHFAFLGD